MAIEYSFTDKRVRDLLKEDLLDVKQILERLMVDPILLCDVIYCICKPQADAEGISDEQFGQAMGGDSKEEADLAIEEPKLAANVAGLTGGGLSFDLEKLSSKGTFNAMAARGLSSAGPMEKVARATEATAANTKKLVQKAHEMRFG